MGREVRRVPANWEHPRDNKNHYIPYFASFPYEAEEVEKGIRDGWLKNEPPNYGCDVMPQWPESERTHYQMYENVTEGIPISPVMESPEALARWLADNRAEASPDQTATYDQWVAIIEEGGVFGSFIWTVENGRGTVSPIPLPS